MIKIDSNQAFHDWMADGAHPAAAIQGLDLRDHDAMLEKTVLAGSIFLSCSLSPAGTVAAVASGAIVIPDSPTFRFPTHRRSLYSVPELFEGYDPSDLKGYHQTYDYRVYLEYLEDGPLDIPLDTGLFRRMHDHSITAALSDLIRGRKVVAIMGGHGMERRKDHYRTVALLARALTRAGYLMVSGGGPGAMEATHLGAYFAPRPDGDLDRAIAMLSPRPADAEPRREYADPDWLQRAWRVREEFPLAPQDETRATSVGIPTWFYGHEPPAPFATHIAKYFANSIREDGLLMIASHGVVFAPGSAGTRQEIFQDAAQNHYATSGFRSPMILLGEDFWTGRDAHPHSHPVWPLLEATVPEERRELLMLSDDLDAIQSMIANYDPNQHREK